MITEALRWNGPAFAVSRHEATPVTFVDHKEAAWIARARTGDEAAYRWLLERYRGRVLRLAANILRRRDDDAEDVAQEAFLRAFRGLGGFHGRSRFSSWLFRIVIRVCVERQRTLARRAEVSPDVAPPISTADTDSDHRLLVASLLDQLSPPMRAALVLREMEGLEYDEISEALDIPVGTVRSRLNAARAHFRRLWLAAEEEKENV